MIGKPRLCRWYLSQVVLIVAILLLASAGTAQNSSQSPTPQFSPDDFKKFSGVFAAFGRVMQKAQGVQYPPPRTESRLMPLLPQSTIAYVALPNYGDAAHQLLGIFNEELKTDTELRTWWESGEMATQGPKIEESIEKFYQLSQYLGDEVVVPRSPFPICCAQGSLPMNRAR